jgi:hypothetical protein
MLKLTPLTASTGAFAHHDRHPSYKALRLGFLLRAHKNLSYGASNSLPRFWPSVSAILAVPSSFLDYDHTT